MILAGTETRAAVLSFAAFIATGIAFRALYALTLAALVVLGAVAYYRVRYGVTPRYGEKP